MTLSRSLRSLESASGHALPDGPPLLVSQLISLRPLQAAQFSAYKRPPGEDEAEDATDLKQLSRKGHLPRVSGSSLLNRVAITDELSEARAAALQRRDKMRDLLRTMSDGNGSSDTSGTFKFLDSFFAAPAPGGDPLAPPLQPLAGATPGHVLEDNSDGEEGDEFEIATPDQIGGEEEGELLAELRGLRRGSQRIVLQKLLQGGMLRADPAAMAEWEEIQKSFRPPEGFRMKVVDVNRTCKGTRSGGLYRFSAMVVVGNGEGVLGWGQGKAAEVNEAVRKAYNRACRNLYPIPRYNGHTIPERMEAKFGKVKVVMYPKSSGRGIVASTLVSDICKMAGVHDVGVKVHGSRNPRNTVKCLFDAFDKMRTHEEIMGLSPTGDKMTVALPPGRFGRLQAM